jgi:hypothetical protein
MSLLFVDPARIDMNICLYLALMLDGSQICTRGVCGSERAVDSGSAVVNRTQGRVDPRSDLGRAYGTRKFAVARVISSYCVLGFGVVRAGRPALSLIDAVSFATHSCVKAWPREPAGRDGVVARVADSSSTFACQNEGRDKRRALWLL